MPGAAFQPSTWELVGVAVPTILVGVWALWDACREPKCRLSARLAIAVSLGSLVQWTAFLVFRASGWWDAADYERVAAPYRLLVLSPVGGWGVWFTAHWFARRGTRRDPATTGSGESSRLGD